MTPELIKYKEDVSKALKEHLTTKEWPNMHPQLVLNELVNMWRVLDEKGLIQHGMTYQRFSQIAHSEFVNFQLRQHFGA